MGMDGLGMDGLGMGIGMDGLGGTGMGGMGGLGMRGLGMEGGFRTAVGANSIFSPPLILRVFVWRLRRDPFCDLAISTYTEEVFFS